jgi:hypothetical protein
MHKFIGLFASSATLLVSSCSPTIPAPKDETAKVEAPQEGAVKEEAVATDEPIGIGTALSSEGITIVRAIRVIGANNRMESGYVIKSNGTRFLCVTDENDYISSLSTTDSLFVTSDSIRVGDSFQKLQPFTTGVLKEKIGCCQIIPTKSGWTAAFQMDEVIVDSSKVLFLYIEK